LRKTGQSGNTYLPVTFGNSPQALLTAAGIAAGFLLFFWALIALTRRKLRHAATTETGVDDFFLLVSRRTKLLLLILPALLLGARALELPKELARLLRLGAILSFVIQTALWASGVIDFWIHRYRKSRMETDPGAVMTVNVFRIGAIVAVWLVAALVAIGNLGFDVSALIAGLGIGGVAVALAVQNILGDLFASLSIVIDKPFVIGDAISVDEHAGTVEHIGLKTTRIRAAGGEQLIFSNGDLLKSRIRNFKRMTERRALMTIGLSHETSAEKLERVPLILRAIVEKQPRTRFDRAHLVNITAAAFEIELVFFVLSAEYGPFADTKQAVILDLVRAFSAEKIDLAWQPVLRM
jgi:small-conductance mechanosensitive channel